MSELLTHTIAQARFEAARQLHLAPAEHPSRTLHGHGFIATVQAKLPPHDLPFLGAQAQTLAQRLTHAVAPLNYNDLNCVLDSPNDLNLAHWVKAALNLTVLEAVGVQSTPDQGVQIDALAHGATRTRIWRRYHFKAAHQLPNVTPGHKCGRMHGHGFEVILHVDSDDETTYDELDAAWNPFQEQLNYRCLNDIEGLSNPTSEMLASWLWHRVKPQLPRLSWVTVYETASCGAQYNGERYQIWKDFSIDSAIKMSGADPTDPRHMIHGDTFLVRLHLCADLDEVMGWTVDFGDVKVAFNPIFKMLDHRPLYEHTAFSSGDTEDIARWTLQTARIDLPQLTRVDVIDSQGAGAVVSHGPLGPRLPV